MLTLDHPGATDDQQHLTWAAPGRERTCFDAEVQTRWMVTARMHPRRFRELVPAPFLAPRPVAGALVVNVCAVQLRPFAPGWSDRTAGPLGLICALRVACLDADGAACSWIARRHTDRGLASVLQAAGLAQVGGGLTGRSAADRLELRADDGLLEVRVGPGHGPAPGLLPDAATAADCLIAPARSYTASATPGRWLAVDLRRQGGDSCDPCRGWEGWLRTPWGDCTIDGVYRTSGGRYRWSVSGEVDEHARFL